MKTKTVGRIYIGTDLYLNIGNKKKPDAWMAEKHDTTAHK